MRGLTEPRLMLRALVKGWPGMLLLLIVVALAFIVEASHG